MPVRRSAEACDAVKQIASLEKAGEDLSIVAAQPGPPKLDRVFAVNNREIVVQIRAPEYFGHRRLQKEGLAEAEGWRKPDPRIRHGRHVCRGPGAIFAAVGEMKLVEQGRTDRGEQVAVDRLNF